MSDIQYRRSPDALHASVGDDVVALHVKNGRCFGMEHVTADVWRILDKPAGLDLICSRLLEEYEVDARSCRTEIAELLEAMQQEGLVEAVASPQNEH